MQKYAKHTQKWNRSGSKHREQIRKQQLEMRRCTLQCENNIGRIDAKTCQKYTKMEPKWELKSIKNEENALKMCVLRSPRESATR